MLKEINNKIQTAEGQINAINRYFTNKVSEEERLQNIIESFKDKFYEKFHQVSEDLNSQIQKFEARIVKTERLTKTQQRDIEKVNKQATLSL